MRRFWVVYDDVSTTGIAVEVCGVCHCRQLCRFCSTFSDVAILVVSVDVVSYNGTNHIPVLVHLRPDNTSLPLYLTSTPIPNLVNDTSHPASHSFTTEISECDANPGKM